MQLHCVSHFGIIKHCREHAGFTRFVGVGIVCGFSVIAYNWKRRYDLKKLAAKTKKEETIAIVQKLNELLKDKDVSFCNLKFHVFTYIIFTNSKLKLA